MTICSFAFGSNIVVAFFFLNEISRLYLKLSLVFNNKRLKVVRSFLELDKD